jgi:hypothetical protein
MVAAYFVAASWLKSTYDPTIIMPKVAGQIVSVQRPYAGYDDSKFAVQATDYWFASHGDSAEDALRSKIVIYEDGMPLGPPHSPHKDIAIKGHGRFSHWRSGPNSSFVFSSSDNTDPRTNGRSYWAVAPENYREEPPPPVPKGKTVILMNKPFESFQDSQMAISHVLGDLSDIADDPDHKSRSPILLYEDDRLLGPAHSRHADIAALGGGRYSHWKTQGMVFSSSDNSDPNTNGRRYWAVLPEDEQQ